MIVRYSKAESEVILRLKLAALQKRIRETRDQADKALAGLRWSEFIEAHRRMRTYLQSRRMILEGKDPNRCFNPLQLN